MIMSFCFRFFNSKQFQVFTKVPLFIQKQPIANIVGKATEAKTSS